MAGAAASRSSLLLLSVLLAALCTSSSAHPEYFGGGYASGCTDHPTQGYGAHKAPQPDSTTTFTITDASGAAVTAVCPGRTYTVAVTFPQPRELYLTAADTAAEPVGVMNNGQADQNLLFGECTNRDATPASEAVATFSAPWKAPTTASGTGVKFEVTSATGSSAPYQQASTTLPYGTAAQCAAGGATTAPAAAGAPARAGAPAPAASAPAASAPAASVPASATTATNVTAANAGNATVAANASSVASQGAAEGAAASSAAVVSSAPVKPIGNCQPSSLGYQCMVTAPDGTIIHFSRGTPPPNNTCTVRASKFATNNADIPMTGMLHFAAQAATQGYVAVSFPESVGTMVPAEAVIGYIAQNGNSLINTHELTEYDAGSPDNANSWASSLGVVSEAGLTTICFSRPVKSKRSQIRSSLVPGAVGLNWAVSQGRGLVLHDSQGGLIISMEDGTSTVATTRKTRAAIAHGALMIVAFAVLMPLGALLARHKWIFGRKEGGLPATWFFSHIGIQVLAVAVALASMILALVVFGSDAPINKLWTPHRILGIIAVAMAVVQLVIGAVRPGVVARGRQQWRWLHYGWGRLALLIGIINLFLGSVLIHDVYFQSRSVYIGVAAGLVGAMLLAFLVLEVFKIRVERKGLYDPVTHRYGARDAAATEAIKPLADIYAGNGRQRADMETGAAAGNSIVKH